MSLRFQKKIRLWREKGCGVAVVIIPLEAARAILNVKVNTSSSPLQGEEFPIVLSFLKRREGEKDVTRTLQEKQGTEE